MKELNQNNKYTSESSSKFVTATQLMNKPADEIPTLLYPIFPKVGIAAVVGSSDTGKSSFLRQFAYSVAYGESHFLGFEIRATHKRAIYVSTEDDESAIEVLLQKQFGRPNEPERTDRLKFIFDSEELLKQLDEEITANPVDVVIIDAFSDLYGNDLNAGSKVRSFLNEYHNLAKRHECLVIFLHHTGKRTDKKAPGKDNIIGSQGFEAKMRVVIDIRKDPKFLDIRHLCIVKGNYLPEELKTQSIVTRFNDQMLFENLQSSVPFDQLKLNKESSKNIWEVSKERAFELKDEENLSTRKISERLNDEGLKGGKTTISEWLKERNGNVRPDNL